MSHPEDSTVGVPLDDTRAHQRDAILQHFGRRTRKRLRRYRIVALLLRWVR